MRMIDWMKQTHQRFGGLIAAACQGSTVPPELLAAFCFSESGKDFKRGWINEQATRFEPGVYQDLISLRDTGVCYVGGKRRTTYNNITQADLAGASDQAIRNLSTSYSVTQIMGWSMVKMLPGTIADLRDINKHFKLAVQRLEIVAGKYLKQAKQTNKQSEKDAAYSAVFRIWNTGSPTGKTYHDSYVPNNLNAMKLYKEMPEVEPVDTSDFSKDLEVVAVAHRDFTEPPPFANSLAAPEPVATAEASSEESKPDAQAIAKIETPVKEMVPDDAPPAEKASGTKSLIATIIGGVGAVFSAIGGFLTSKEGVIILGIVAFVLVVLMFILRQTIVGLVREWINSDPYRKNIRKEE